MKKILHCYISLQVFAQSKGRKSEIVKIKINAQNLIIFNCRMNPIAPVEAGEIVENIYKPIRKQQIKNFKIEGSKIRSVSLYLLWFLS